MNFQKQRPVPMQIMMSDKSNCFNTYGFFNSVSIIAMTLILFLLYLSISVFLEKLEATLSLDLDKIEQTLSRDIDELTASMIELVNVVKSDVKTKSGKLDSILKESETKLKSFNPTSLVSGIFKKK